jgi:hypothetical protein
MRSKILFSECDLRAALEGHERKMYDEIDKLERRRALDTSVDDLCDYFEKEYRIQVPQLDETRIEVKQKDTQVDVRNDPRRAVFDRSRPVYIPGTQISFLVPFKGDKEIFKCRPSSFNLNPPHGIVNETELILAYTVIDQGSESIRASFDRDLAQIRQWLSYVENDATAFNTPLRSKARQRIERRREKLTHDQSLAVGLGFPIRNEGN